MSPLKEGMTKKVRRRKDWLNWMMVEVLAVTDELVMEEEAAERERYERAETDISESWTVRSLWQQSRSRGTGKQQR
ncbi:hypothetical protein COCNU_04G007340 [Cocos nucifera]|uniref:Uncharacterized protein n=1 Tax=Cocos nucifera TaxID=13894 RepID=A0A8K0I6S9_COCNU|nr:hypothetical protein COCNU_04G007340 [Cocos nucifera]